MGNHQPYKGIILTGSNNITSWKRAVKIHGDVEGTSLLWRHIGTGTDRKPIEALISKPDRPARPVGALTRDLKEVYRDDIEIYKFESEEYNRQRERERNAKQMFLKSVDDHIKAQIVDKNSRDCWVYLSNAFAVAESMAQSILYSQLATVKLASCNNMQQYLSTITNIKQDLAEHNEALSAPAHKNAILSGLTFGYNHLVEQVHFDAGTGTGTSVAELEKKLYVQESILTLRKEKTTRDKTDKDKTDKDKTDKDKTDKDALRKGSGGGRNTTNADGAATRVVCEHCKGNGHSIDTCKYVGKPDTPKCTYKDCGKLGHVETECFMKAKALKEPKPAADVKLAGLAINNDIDFGMDRFIGSVNNLDLN
ncbi:hypothetical protein EJ02DRAFT_458229, partial [Clathrospora elynae]